MQDRFKFRAWNKLSNEMKDVISLNINHSFPDCSNVILETNTFDNINPITCANGLENVVLMQCTGLKDKNSKLIYEGDIVNMQHWRTPREIIYINGAYCGWYMKQTKEEKGCTGKDCLSFSSEHIGKAEVIGNIYENPELLEVQNA